MKKAILFSLLIPAFGLLSSCEKVVEVEVDPGETLLVVDAWITDLPGTQKVRLTTTAPIFNNGNTPAANGATVSIKDLDNNKVYSFTEFNNSGDYIFNASSGDTLCVLGHHYQLNVSFNGDQYISYSTLYPSTSIDTIGFNYEKESNGQGGTTIAAGYFAYLFGKDIQGQSNHYWIKTYKNGLYFSKASNINVAEDGGGGPGTDGLCFIPPNAYFGVTDNLNRFQLGDICRVEVHSLNKESYEYLIQLQTQLNNSSSGLFAVTPENLRTNISKVNESSPRVIGWFNIASVKVKEAVCTDNLPIIYNCP